MVPHITQSEFAEKVENVSYPVLVDFFATWCGPCKMMAPVLDRVALAKQGKAAVYKVDVDQEPELAQRFGVMSVPTLIVFKGVGLPLDSLWASSQSRRCSKLWIKGDLLPTMPFGKVAIFQFKLGKLIGESSVSFLICSSKVMMLSFFRSLIISL